MHNKLLTLALFVSGIASLSAQGICDSTISISPIQPLCAGTGERYLQASHPGGVFTGPGLIYNNAYLTSEFLGAGFYTAKYTITGPGGCTVQATRQFEVLDAEEAFTAVSGQIDCSNPGSTVLLTAFLMNAQNYNWSSWDGPPGSNVYLNGNTGLTGYAGTYRFTAYPANFGDCPAYGHADVAFVNNPTPIHIVSCTDCSEWNGNPPLRLKIDTVPPGWIARLRAPNGAGIAGASGCVAVSSFFPSGVWQAEITNQQNGCRSAASANLNTQYAKPSVSSGSDLALWCGGTGHLLPAMLPASGNEFNYFWATPGGNTVPAAYAQLLPVTAPGRYVLHGINTFTGCEDTDTSFVFPPVIPSTTRIGIICDGESLNGHTQAGSYVDTITLPNGCFKVEYLKLNVLAPLQDSVEVTADNGLMAGSIEYFVTQGWPPYSYYWSTGDVTAALHDLSAGEYTVTVTDANNCQHVRTILVPSGKPVQGLMEERSAPLPIRMRLYPNPADAGVVQCNLEIIAPAEAGEASILAIDVLGRIIAAHTVQIGKGKQTISWSATLPEGVYSLFLKGGGIGLQQVETLVVSDR